jgi:hypothetical protein
MPKFDTTADDIDRHFPFNNEEDFTTTPNMSSFSFPNAPTAPNPSTNGSFSFPATSKTPDLSKSSPRYTSTLSPGRRASFLGTNSLHSPIKLGTSYHRQTKSSSYIKTRFFNHEDYVDDDDIPSAVIDLDEILNANLSIGDTSCSNELVSQHQIPTDDIFPPDDDFLASPFTKQSISNPFINSPYHNVNSTPIVEQPIEEQTDSIAEEDDIDIDRIEIHDNVVIDDSDDEFFLHPPPPGSIYNNASANSSSSSLRRLPNSHLIEKTLSNSSKDSTNSGTAHNIRIVTPPPIGQKRSGAKANRYQIFYDQSNRISNALKNSSSDSINLVRTNSNGSKELRSLGHSSSLPSLKSLRRANSYHYPLPRFTELRNTRMGSPPIGPVVPSSSSQSSLRETTIVDNTENRSEMSNKSTELELPPSPPNNTIKHNRLESNETETEPFTTIPNLDDATGDGVENSSTSTTKYGKSIATSPISIESTTSSTGVLSNRTTDLTDHSSYASEQQAIRDQKPEKSCCVDNETMPLLEVAMPLSGVGMSPPQCERPMTPTIVISGENDGTSSLYTTNTFLQQDGVGSSSSKKELTGIAPVPKTVKLLTSNVVINPAIDHDVVSNTEVDQLLPVREPRRPLSPSEKNILQATQIPAYNRKAQKPNQAGAEPKSIKKQSSTTTLGQQTKQKYSHRKTKSFSTNSLRSYLGTLEDEQDTDQKLKRRSSRFIGWFRRK